MEVVKNWSGKGGSLSLLNVAASLFCAVKMPTMAVEKLPTFAAAPAAEVSEAQVAS